MAKKASDDSESEAPPSQQPGVASDGTAGPPAPAATTVEIESEAEAGKIIRKGKRKAEKIDLATALSGGPGKSKHRQSLKELKEEKERVQAEQRAASKKHKLAVQRQKRLLDKASSISNEDLLEIFNQRRENQEQCKKKRWRRQRARLKPKRKQSTLSEPG